MCSYFYWPATTGNDDTTNTDCLTDAAIAPPWNLLHMYMVDRGAAAAANVPNGVESDS